MKVIVEPILLHRDARGAVFEPLDMDAIAAQHNVHVAVTEPGGIRANHYHVRGTEVLAVYGPALVRFRTGGDVSETIVPDDEAFRFTFPAGVSHAIQNTGRKPNILVGFNTEAHYPDSPNVVPDILIAP